MLKHTCVVTDMSASCDFSWKQFNELKVLKILDTVIDHLSTPGLISTPPLPPGNILHILQMVLYHFTF